MATLLIAHYIYLTKEQRYSLHQGNSLDVIGVSVPVWFDKGNTSEPAKELFCKYNLTNDSKNRPIDILTDGYSINLPQKPSLETDDGTIKAVFINYDTSERLLDVADGGVEWLEFREYTKIELNYEEHSLVHMVEIKRLDLLEKTLS